MSFYSPLAYSPTHPFSLLYNRQKSALLRSNREQYNTFMSLQIWLFRVKCGNETCYRHILFSSEALQRETGCETATHTHHQTQDTFDRFARGFHTKAGRTTLYTLAEGGNHDDSGQNNLKNRRATCYQNRTSKTLSIYIAACDADQQELVKAAGFAEAARLQNRFRDGKGYGCAGLYVVPAGCGTATVEQRRLLWWSKTVACRTDRILPNQG